MGDDARLQILTIGRDLVTATGVGGYLHLRDPQYNNAMKVIALQSGSNGNCIYVESKGVRLLFDAGISGTHAQMRMAAHVHYHIVEVKPPRTRSSKWRRKTAEKGEQKWLLLVEKMG